MKKLLLASLAGFAFAVGSANAADLPYKAPAPRVAAPVPWTWTVFYIGAHVGGGWGAKEFYDPSHRSIGSFDVNGFLGGPQAGYNYQMGWVVLGVEGDFSWADIKGDGLLAGNHASTAKADWLATLTGRIGGTVDHALLYMKGGVAWAHDKYTLESFTGEETRTGYVVGGGVEYAFTRNWSGKFEYNFMDFSTNNVDLCVTSGCRTLGLRQRIHAVKVGMNYRFDWGR